MAEAQGIEKELIYKKQASGKGTAESGSGGQLLRRETATFTKTRDSYTSNEINSHQQHVGDIHGIARSQGTVNGNLSPTTYSDFVESLLRQAAAATSDITSLSLTIATSGSNYTVTRASGSFLTGGIKVGDVVQLSGGSLNAANVGKSLVVLGVTATVLTVNVLDSSSSLTAEGPVASCTVSVPGKKIVAANTSHTNDYYTFEEYFSDIARSHVWPDVKIGSMEVSVPASGNVSATLNFLGLGERTKGASQILTSPSSETTTDIVQAIDAALFIGTTRYTTMTSLSVTLDGQMGHGEATIGSNYVTDIQKGDLKASGTFTLLFEDDTETDLFDNETETPLIIVVPNSDGEFISIVATAVKVFSDDADDGKKQIVRTFNWVAKRNGDGGSGTAYDQAIVAVQDSTL